MALGRAEAAPEAAQLVVVRAPRAKLPLVPSWGRMVATWHACHVAWAQARGERNFLRALDLLGVLVDTHSLPAAQMMSR